MLGKRAVAVRPFGENRDARGPVVLVTQVKDLYARSTHVGVILIIHKPVHEDQVDEVTVPIVTVLGIGVIGVGVQLLRDESWRRARCWSCVSGSTLRRRCSSARRFLGGLS
jgi:hypothetical protein